MFQRLLKAKICRNKCHKSSHHVVVNDDVDDSMRLCPVNNNILSNTREKDVRDRTFDSNWLF